MAVAPPPPAPAPTPAGRGGRVTAAAVSHGRSGGVECKCIRGNDPRSTLTTTSGGVHGGGTCALGVGGARPRAYRPFSCWRRLAYTRAMTFHASMYRSIHLATHACTAATASALAAPSPLRHRFVSVPPRGGGVIKRVPGASCAPTRSCPSASRAWARTPQSSASSFSGAFAVRPGTSPLAHERPRRMDPPEQEEGGPTEMSS